MNTGAKYISKKFVLNELIKHVDLVSKPFIVKNFIKNNCFQEKSYFDIQKINSINKSPECNLRCTLRALAAKKLFPH